MIAGGDDEHHFLGTLGGFFAVASSSQCSVKGHINPELNSTGRQPGVVEEVIESN